MRRAASRLRSGGGWAVVLALIAFALMFGRAEAQQPTASRGTIPQQAWRAYVDRFVTNDGRVVDDANGGISHSESQGYGLLLAYLADDRATFAQIWSFTRTELLLRDDGLLVWKWNPATQPRVRDVNNAADGDLLVAYALALAGTGWNRLDYTDFARGIAAAIAEELIVRADGRTVLKPAATGFWPGEREDAPVINLSYWIFEAFPALAALAPEGGWDELTESGRTLVAEARFGPERLPSDWITLGDPLRPAAGFPPEFGYNALRIPLYLVRAGETRPDLLRPFHDALAKAADGGIALIDVTSGRPVAAIREPGYLAVHAAVACVLDGTRLSDSVTSFRPTRYYPSTLHLLALSFVAERHAECL